MKSMSVTSSSSTSSGGNNVNINNNRSAYLSILGYIIRECIHVLENKDIENLINLIISILKDQCFVLLPYAEQTFFKVRLSYYFRYAITSSLSENKLINLINLLTLYISDIDGCTEHELLYVLGELSHILTVVGEAVINVESIQSAVNMHLRNSAYGVRYAGKKVKMRVCM